MRANITLKDMAGILGVSVSTVSKALSNSPEIGHKTKSKVNDLASLHQYKRNNQAYSLRSKKTNIIGVVIPQLNNEYISNVIDGITYEANKRDYKLMTYQTKDSYTNEVNSINTLNGSVDGIIVSTAIQTLKTNKNEHLSSLVNDKFPVVMFDRIIDTLNCDKVVSNYFESAFKATTDLIKSGKRNIGLLINPNYDYASQLWKQGYCKALASAGINIKTEYILQLEKNQVEYHNRIERLISSKKLDAIISIDETYALEVIKIAQQYAISIPNELSLLTFKGDGISKHLSPTITNISQNGYLIGRRTAQLLFNRILSKPKAGFIVNTVTTTTTHRESTGANSQLLSISA